MRARAGKAAAVLNPSAKPCASWCALLRDVSGVGPGVLDGGAPWPPPPPVESAQGYKRQRARFSSGKNRRYEEDERIAPRSGFVQLDRQHTVSNCRSARFNEGPVMAVKSQPADRVDWRVWDALLPAAWAGRSLVLGGHLR